MTIQTHFIGILVIYCLIFAWLSVPFVTAEKGMLRKQVMFVDRLQEKISADEANSVTLAAALPAAVESPSR